MITRFHFCTIANKRPVYEAMRASLAAAGFDETNSSFTLLDNTAGNQYEPYSAFNKIAAERQEPYLIFCHQDILLNQGHGHDRLVQLLDELSEKYPRWLVAGNAGIRSDLTPVARIVDPYPTVNWTGSLPQRVVTLDENFLAIRNNSKVRWSSCLAGFHFYGPDICLNAIQQGRTCHVIDFKLEHLSAGSLNANFWEMKEKFHHYWNGKFHLAFMMTPTGVFMSLSKHAWLRRLLAYKFIAPRLNRPKARWMMERLRLVP